MKAARIHAFGGPEVVTYEDVPKPTPKEHEVLFKVTSTCMNYADVQWRLGNYVDRTLPATLGREAAGIIEAVGPGVTSLKVGQPIMARAPGGHAEYGIAQVNNVFPCPAGLDMAQAGGIPIIFLTAYHLLRSMKRLQSGDTVLVQAAASGVGTVLLQLGKQWGFRSIATASTDAKLQLAHELGAAETINYATQDFPAEVMRLTNGTGVQLALEAVGGDVTEKSMRCLAPGGCLVNYGNASNKPASLPLAAFRENRAAMGFSLTANLPGRDNQAAMAEILGLIVDKKVRLIVDQVLPLSEAAKAHAHLSNRGARGKVLLIP
ncbi:MAG: zinc-binding dehydrogenase [Nitrospinae bacterium]|nr:zinc-binding dehydrogenase [Nitrospinota bacterium]